MGFQYSLLKLKNIIGYHAIFVAVFVIRGVVKTAGLGLETRLARSWSLSWSRILGSRSWSRTLRSRCLSPRPARDRQNSANLNKFQPRISLLRKYLKFLFSMFLPDYSKKIQFLLPRIVNLMNIKKWRMDTMPVFVTRCGN